MEADPITIIRKALLESPPSTRAPHKALEGIVDALSSLYGEETDATLSPSETPNQTKWVMRPNETLIKALTIDPCRKRNQLRRIGWESDKSGCHVATFYPHRYGIAADEANPDVPMLTLRTRPPKKGTRRFRDWIVVYKEEQLERFAETNTDNT